MNRNRKSTKCKTRESVASEDLPLSQKDELPGIDYKNKLGPRSLRHNKLNLNTPEGETRFLSSVTKELSKKQNVQKIQNAFQQQQPATATALASKQIWVTNQEVCVNFSCPLDGISTATYIQKWKNTELIKEIPVGNLEDEQDAADAVDKHARPGVIAVNMKWKNGVQVKQCHKFSTRTRQLEPVMKQTDFDYETKTKFSKEVESVCEQLFPDGRKTLMILDGNDSHGMFASGAGDSVKSAKTARSDKLKEDSAPQTPYTPGNTGDPHTREWKEFTDMEEHRVLVVPSHSRTGFDMDLTKHYQFPYQAKFVIGRRAYHHQFILRVPLSKTPQHYGLIFTFSEDPKGHSKLRIKSLLTVYSICPQTPKYACLETYEVDDAADVKEDPRSSRSTQSGRAAKQAVELISDNLKEEKVTSGFMNTYELRRELPNPANDLKRSRRLLDKYDKIDDSLPAQRQKKKQQLQRNIRMEQARC